MDWSKHKILLLKILPHIILTTFVILLLWRVFFLKGLITGEDIAFPLTKVQTFKTLQVGLSSWYFNELFTYRNYSVGNYSLIQGLQFLFVLVGLGSAVFVKALIFFVFLFSALSIYSLLRFLKVGCFAAVLGSIFYITTPVFFDYTIMGWFYLFIAIGLLPLALKYFIKSVEEDRKEWAMLSAIFLALAFIQPQSIIWFNIILLAFSFYIIKSKRDFKVYLKNYLIILSSFLFLTAYITLITYIFPDKAVSGSSYVNAIASLGMTMHFVPQNIIRLWGSLYNFQYESIIIASKLTAFSFLVPAVLLLTFVYREKIRLTISLWIIALSPFLMYFLNFHRDWLANIPFSNVIRDFARFSVLSNFAYALLFALSIQYLWQNRSKLKYLLILVLIGWFIYLKPWWSGELTAWQNREGHVSRLTAKTYSPEYYHLEDYFDQLKLDTKALYLPHSFNGSITDDDPKYPEGLRDIFAINSPVTGLLTRLDRKLGPTDFANVVLDSYPSQFGSISKLIGVQYIAVRDNFKIEETEKAKLNLTIEGELKKGRIKEFFHEGIIRAYKINDYLPRFYVADNVLRADVTEKSVPELFSKQKENSKTAIILDKQNLNNSVNTNFDKSEGTSLEYKKISPVKYRLRIKNAKTPFFLASTESFDSYWRVYVRDFAQTGKDELKANSSNYNIKDISDDSVTQQDLNAGIQSGEITALRKNTLFVSKKNQGTIQNDNLPDSSVFETWFKDPSKMQHLEVNGYANGWVFDPASACEHNVCKKNTDGSYDFEIVIEYWFQRVFYLGITISALTFLLLISYIILRIKKTKKIIEIST